MKVALLGDMAFFGCFNVKNNPNLKINLKEISNYLSTFDLVVGNLETPFSVEKKTFGAKSAYISADIENVEVLKWLHIKVVNLANNHMFDFGKEGYETTKKMLNDAGIDYFGTEGKIVTIEKESNRLMFSGYCCYSTNPLMLADSQGGYGVNKYNLADVQTSIQKSDKDGFLNIVAAHVGLEHVNYPSLDHIRAARQLADSCRYIYYGHHPHVVQGVEEYNGSLIAHSLGNFCFDDVYTSASRTEPLIRLSEQNRTGMILEVTIEQNKVVGWKEQLIHIESDGGIRLIEDKEGVLALYNEALKKCDRTPDYEAKRRYIINARIKERKAKRDLQWFLKRLRPRYVKLIIDMRMNAKLYNSNIKQYLR